MSDTATTTPPKIVPSRGSRLRIWPVLILIVAALVAFMAVSQLRGPDRFSQQLSSENEGDLARILASLESESTAQQDQLSQLKVELANLKNSSATQGAASAAVNAELNSLQVLAGTVPVTGPGLDLVVQDPNNQVTYDVLVDTIQELRDAGAEAIAINGKRIGAQSSFTTSNHQISLDGAALNAPYDIAAIGPAATMEGGLQIPGGSIDTLKALNGVAAEIHRSNSLTLPALASPPVFHSARPS